MGKSAPGPGTKSTRHHKKRQKEEKIRHWCDTAHQLLNDPDMTAKLAKAVGWPHALDALEKSVSASAALMPLDRSSTPGPSPAILPSATRAGVGRGTTGYTAGRLATTTADEEQMQHRNVGLLSARPEPQTLSSRTK
jgi:hypothetical protein